MSTGEIHLHQMATPLMIYQPFFTYVRWKVVLEVLIQNLLYCIDL